MAALSTRRMLVSAVSSDEGTWLRGGVLLTRIFAQFPQQWNLLLNGNTLPQSLKTLAETVLDRAQRLFAPWIWLRFGKVSV